jgi:hypothetical protein
VPTPSSPVPPLSVPASTGVGEVVGEGVSVSVSAPVGGESSDSGSGSRGGVVTAAAVCCPSDPTPSSSLDVTSDNVAVVVSEPVRMSDPTATSDTPQIAALSMADSSSVISIPTGTVGQGQGPGEGDSVNLPQGSCSLLPSAVSVVEIQPSTSSLSLSLSLPSLPSSLPLSSPLPPSSQPLPTI